MGPGAGLLVASWIQTVSVVILVDRIVFLTVCGIISFQTVSSVLR